VILSDLAKYSMTRSIARSVCDSWASCQPSRPTQPSHLAQCDWPRTAYRLKWMCLY